MISSNNTINTYTIKYTQYQNVIPKSLNYDLRDRLLDYERSKGSIFNSIDGKTIDFVKILTKHLLKKKILTTYWFF